MIPPMVMWLKTQWFGIWVPLILLWPIVLALVAIGMAIAGRIDRFWMALRVVLATYTMLCALRGLQIEIHKEDKTFEIYLP